MKSTFYRPVADIALDGANAYLEMIRFTSYTQICVPQDLIKAVQDWLTVAEQHNGNERKIAFYRKKLEKYTVRRVW